MRAWGVARGLTGADGSMHFLGCCCLLSSMLRMPPQSDDNYFLNTLRDVILFKPKALSFSP